MSSIAPTGLGRGISGFTRGFLSAYGSRDDRILEEERRLRIDAENARLNQTAKTTSANSITNSPYFSNLYPQLMRGEELSLSQFRDLKSSPGGRGFLDSLANFNAHHVNPGSVDKDLVLNISYR